MKTQIFSENDFIEFSNKVESLCEKVQLTDWRWSVVSAPLDHDDAAAVYLNYRAKTAKFVLAEAFQGEVVTHYYPEELAIHEFLHLLIADLIFDEINILINNIRGTVVITFFEEVFGPLVWVL